VLGRRVLRSTRKPAEGFLRCVAARPAGAGRKKGRRHFGRNDRLGAGRGARCRGTKRVQRARNPAANRRLRRYAGTMRTKTSREILHCVAARTCLPRKLPLPGTFARRRNGTQEKCRPPLRFRMTRGFRTLRWFASRCDGLGSKKSQPLGMTGGCWGRRAMWLTQSNEKARAVEMTTFTAQYISYQVYCELHLVPAKSPAKTLKHAIVRAWSSRERSGANASDVCAQPENKKGADSMEFNGISPPFVRAGRRASRVQAHLRK